MAHSQPSLVKVVCDVPAGSASNATITALDATTPYYLPDVTPGDTFYGCFLTDGAGNWQYGGNTWTASGNGTTTFGTFSRTSIRSSEGLGLNAVFSGNPCTFIMDIPGEKGIYLDVNGNLVNGDAVAAASAKPSFSELVNQTPPSAAQNGVVFRVGYGRNAGDGLGGSFRWVFGDATPADDHTTDLTVDVIAPLTGGGRYIRVLDIARLAEVANDAAISDGGIARIASTGVIRTQNATYGAKTIPQVHNHYAGIFSSYAEFKALASTQWANGDEFWFDGILTAGDCAGHGFVWEASNTNTDALDSTHLRPDDISGANPGRARRAVPGAILKFSDGDATPTVKASEFFRASDAGTAITGLDDAIDLVTYVVFPGAADVTFTHSASFVMPRAQDFELRTTANGGAPVFIVYEDGVGYLTGGGGASAQSEFDTFAALKAATALENGKTYATKGRNAATDGRSCVYRFTTSETATADDGAVINPTNVTGRLIAVEYTAHGIVRPEWYDLEVDGSEDNQTELQAAVTAAIAATKGNYLICRHGDRVRSDGIIKQPGHAKIICDGEFIVDFREKTTNTDDTALGWNSADVYGASDPAFRQAVCWEIYNPSTGRGGSFSALASNASANENSLSLASGGVSTIGLSNGEQQESYVQILSADGYVSRKTGSASARYLKAEMHRVFQVDTSGDTLELEDSLWEDYPTSEDERVYPVTFTDGCVMEGITFWGLGMSASPHYWSTTHASVSSVHQIGVAASWQKNLRIERCKFLGFKVYGVSLVHCYRYKVNDNEFRGSQHASTDNTVAFLYGVNVYHGCHYGQIKGNFGSLLRHLVATSYSSTEVGGSYHLHVVDNFMTNAELTAEGLSASWAYEEHGGLRFGIWEGNTAQSCYAGFNIEGPDQIIKGNIIEDFQQTAILFTSNPDMSNLVITGNLIRNWTGGGETSSGFPRGGIVLNHSWDSETDGIISDVVISGNVIENYPTIGIALIGAKTIDNVRIDGNTIGTNAGDDPTSSGNIKGGIHCYPTGTSTVNGLAITNNSIHEFWDGTAPSAAYYYGIYLQNNSTTGSGNIVANNTIFQESLADDSHVIAFWCSYANTVINGNNISNVSWGLCVSTAECNVTGNTVSNDSNPTIGAGLYFNGDRCVASGNQITMGRYAMHLTQNATDNLVCGNYFYDSAAEGIYIEGDQNAVITNHVMSAGADAIEVTADGSKNRVIGNMVRNTTTKLTDNGSGTVTAWTTTGYDDLD